MCLGLRRKHTHVYTVWIPCHKKVKAVLHNDKIEMRHEVRDRNFTSWSGYYPSLRSMVSWLKTLSQRGGLTVKKNMTYRSPWGGSRRVSQYISSHRWKVQEANHALWGTPVQWPLFVSLLSLSLFSSGMTIPEEDTEAGQTGKYCLVAIGRLQVRMCLCVCVNEVQRSTWC